MQREEVKHSTFTLTACPDIAYTYAYVHRRDVRVVSRCPCAFAALRKEPADYVRACKTQLQY